jgi:hypothetical protein
MTSPALLDWLLEPEEPSARYLALRHLLARPEGDPDVVAAREAIVGSPPVRAMLDAQYPDGYWIKPDRGYSPRYKATTWQLIFLADLGAARTAPIARACEHVIAHAIHTRTSLFSAHVHSSGVWPCLNGNLLRALCHFGYGEHPVVQAVIAALARRVLEYGFTCPRNGARNSANPKDWHTWQPCPWGWVKVLRGFAALPRGARTPDVRQATERGVAYLLSHDLAQDQRPARVDVPSHWLRFGYPLGYGSDLLEALLALVELESAPPADRSGRTSPPVSRRRDPAGGEETLPPPFPRERATIPAPSEWGAREEALEFVLQKRDPQGRWPLEHALGNTWADFGQEGRPNKWVTLRACRVIAAPR